MTAPRSVGVWMAVLLGACTHAPRVTPPLASPVASVESRASVSPASNGTCTVTTAEAVYAHTYEAGFLVRSATDGVVETLYTYEGDRLVRIETTRNGGVIGRRELRYDLRGRLEVLVEVAQIPEREIRRFEYDTAGRLTRLIMMSNEGAPYRACTLRYDDLGRVVRYTCAALDYVGSRPDVTTYEYDGEGRLIEYRSGGWIWQRHYDAAGRWERVEVRAPQFGVQSTTTVVRDEQGRERELRSDMGELGFEVDVVVFDGTFGATRSAWEFPRRHPASRRRSSGTTLATSGAGSEAWALAP